MTITSPLEQFQILPVIPFSIGNFDFSITNSTVIILIGLFSFCFLLNALVNDKGSYNLVPNRWQVVVEGMYELISGLLKDTLGGKGQEYFPYVFTLFSFILIANLIGLVPYSFTVTSHLIVTFTTALAIFAGMNIIGILKHRKHFLSLFFPPGSPVALAPLLVIIELVSYVFRVISLSVRLFANLMSGHTLLKILAGFS